MLHNCFSDKPPTILNKPFKRRWAISRNYFLLVSDGEFQFIRCRKISDIDFISNYIQDGNGFRKIVTA